MMIIYVVNGNVLWTNKDVSIKEQEQFINDDSCIVINKVVEFPEIPDDGHNYTYHWNEEKQEIELLQGVKETPIKEVIKSTHDVVETTSFDNLINMDMLLALDEKLNVIMEHLGIEY